MRDLDAYLQSKGLPTTPRYHRLNGFLGIDIEIPRRAAGIEKELVNALYSEYSKSDVSMAIKIIGWHESVNVKAIKYPGAKEYSPKEYIDGLVADLQCFVADFVSARTKEHRRKAFPAPTIHAPEPPQSREECCGNCKKIIQPQYYDYRSWYEKEYTTTQALRAQQIRREIDSSPRPLWLK